MMNNIKTDSNAEESSSLTKPDPAEVANAFMTPRRPQRVRPLLLEDGETLWVTTPEGEVALQRAGSGPQVLLVHGWEGQAADLSAFASALLGAGLSVVALDLPAHGASKGERSSIPQAARALKAVGHALGPFHGAVAHSLGSPVLVEAMHAGMQVSRVVLIAAPAHYERYARGFAAAAGLDSQGADAMLDRLQEVMGMDVREVSLPARAPHLAQPALFIHSSDDRIVSIEDSLASAAAWPNARHLRVDGLGHGRILADPRVVDTTTQFVLATTHSKE